jgi:hypothetical protein
MMSEKNITIISGRHLNLERPKSGEEAFLQHFVKTLREAGFKVAKIDPSDSKRIENLRKSQIHLVYLPFRSLLLLKKMYPQSTFVYHVYYLNYATLPKYSEIKWRAGLALMSLFVDSYLSTSPVVVQDLRRIILPSRNIFLLEPYYKCNNCSFDCNYKLWSLKVKELQHGFLKILYIGYLNEWRFPYYAILRGLTRLKHKVDLTVYTAENVNEKVYKYHNVTMHIYPRYLSENLKCDVYRGSHFFMYLPSRNAAIVPPMTLIEAVYHGAVPIVSSSIEKVIPNMPLANIVNNINGLSDSVADLIDMILSQSYPFNALLNAFQHYYNKERFLSQLFTILQA